MKDLLFYVYNVLIKWLVCAVPLSKWCKRLRKKLLHKTAFPSDALFLRSNKKRTAFTSHGTY